MQVESLSIPGNEMLPKCRGTVEKGWFWGLPLHYSRKGIEMHSRGDP